MSRPLFLHRLVRPTAARCCWLSGPHFFPDGFDVGRAAQQAVANEREHGADGVAAGFGIAGIMDLPQGVAQAAQGVVRKGAAGSAGGFGDGFLMLVGQLAGQREQRAGVFLQGADPELLGTFEVLIEVGAVAAEAFGQAERCPVGDFVEGALMDGRVVKTFGQQGTKVVNTLPLGGQFAQGEAEALAGEVGAAVRVDDDKATQLDDEFEAVGTGHCIPTDPFVAVLETLGGTGPAEDGDEPLDTAFRIVFPSSLPQNVPGGTSGLEVMLLVEGGTQLADFEWFGGRADGQIVAPQDRCIGWRGDDTVTTMAKSGGLFIENSEIPSDQ